MGNQNTTDENNTIKKYEKKAVEIANQCKRFIAFIRNPEADIDEFMKSQYETLKKNCLYILEKINQDAINNQLPEVNYYYLYLLQQVSKLNQYVNQDVIIKDNRESELKVVILNKPHDRYKAFKKAGITTIVHPLLNQPEQLSMSISVEQGNIFRDTYIDDDDGKRFYYHPRTTEKGHKHQDREHYMKANMMIGGPTQVSNATGLFKATEIGQGTHHYFKHADRNLHKKEQKLFKSAMDNIHNGKLLSKDEKNILESGKYYRYNSPVKFKPVMANKDEKPDIPRTETDRDYQILHIGHAAEFISMQNSIPLNLCIDPVHYQSGTGGIIGVGGKILYDRYTDPAFGTDGYPGLNIVLISHNHFDHMCKDSIKEAFGQSNTLFIVPAGDAKHLKAFGIANVIEMGSWNDVVRINLSDKQGNSSSYEILSFPANHASCRGTSDLFESLYMGYMIRDVSKNHIVLCTGDTAVLDVDHFQQLDQYLLDKSYSISTACIAHGPDRPRSWMECTHQSTADAITMHAEFNVMNARVFAKRLGIKPEDLTFEQLEQSACYAIGYHQGCYRLGLLSLSDVDTTLLRTFAVLASFGNIPVNEIAPELLEKNVFFNFMDKFEQKSLVSTLEVYSRLKIASGCLTAEQTVAYICSHLNVPQPGARADFSKDKPYESFVFDYERLLLNRNPELKAWDEYKFKGAADEFCHQLKPELYLGDFSKINLVIQVLSLYLERPVYYFTKNHEHIFAQFIDELKQGKIKDEELDEKLGELYTLTHPQQDEDIRDEGHSHTALTLIAGLLHFPDFREKMHARYNELNNIVVLEEGVEMDMNQIGLNF